MKKIKNILEAPEGYFDQLPQQIQKRIQDKKQRKSILQVVFQPKYALVLASVALLLIIGGKYLPVNQQNTQQIDFVEISSQQISQYLLQEGIQENELVEYLQYSTTEEDSDDSTIKEILEDEIDFEEIEEIL
jgi:hypothetical protein